MKHLTLGLLAISFLALATPAFARHVYWNNGWDGYQSQVMYTPQYGQGYYTNAYPYGNGYGYSNMYNNGYGYGYVRQGRVGNFLNRILGY